MTHVIVPRITAGENAQPRPPVKRPGGRRRLVLTVLAVVMFVAAVLVLGLDGLVPFGLLLAFSVDSDDEESSRSAIVTPRNLGLAAAMVAIFACFWLWRLDLRAPALVVIGGALIALPLALQESSGDATRDRIFVVTKRSLILGLWGLVVLVYCYSYGQSFNAVAAVCVILPLAVVPSRVWRARRGQVQFGLLRHPLRRQMRPYLLQGVNIWLCCLLIGGLLAAGGAHYARIGFSLNGAQFNVMIAAFTAGLVLLAALAVVPRRRIYLTTNVVVALVSGFLAVQLVQVSVPATDAVVLDSPLPGVWFVLNGGSSVLLNGHSSNESNAVDFQRLGANGRTHTGGSDAPLADYAGFGIAVLAPADGLIVEVIDGYADNPPGTNGDHANYLVIEIGGGRFVTMAHLQHGSLMVQVGDQVGRGQPLAAVGNNGHSNEPHLHLQVQDSAAGADVDRTYPMVFRNVHITRAGAWPWRVTGELRTGDLVRTEGQ